jgi:hypothetical protein
MSSLSKIDGCLSLNDDFHQWSPPFAMLDFKPIYEGLALLHRPVYDIGRGSPGRWPQTPFGSAVAALRRLDEKELAMELRKKLTMQQILIDDVTNVR